jgi:hypothetical protein
VAEKFVTTADLPTPHQVELLTILIEEASEVIKGATKALRFGLMDVEPGQAMNNKLRLGLEVGDFYEMASRCTKAGIISAVDVGVGRKTKTEKLKIYLQTEGPGSAQ